ncbi:MAG TPA: UDP-3-O-(3-hydroxymyristoyl)glucosamine N-acyltransferase, partial [Thiotrichales bacterium]|nr:UDP-3-O-(3-hydroxymyristoyl)glucosamine N-acyltransferase [Thiotrichales bacterium]
MALMLSEIAAKTGSELLGDDCEIENVADITQAQQGQLAFISHAKYVSALKTTAASAVILKKVWLADCAIPALVTDKPRLIFARAANLLNPPGKLLPGIAASASVAGDAVIHDSVRIEDNAVIRPGCRLGANVSIGAGCVIENNVTIGDNTRLYANVTIQQDCHIGENVILHSGVVIGTDGFGFIRDGESYLKIPQIGRVRIGNNVEVGANTSIDRGALLDTIIHDGVKLDNHIQIGHNVEIGEHTVVSAYTGIAGSTKIGRDCLIGGGVGIRDNIEIADGTVITGRSFVSSSVREPGVYSSSVLLDTNSNWKKN